MQIVEIKSPAAGTWHRDCELRTLRGRPYLELIS